MNGTNFRAGRQASPAPTSRAVIAPHAALLIDFDNVTMGIRSDLTKELKALLNSDIIRGKVTVQRAYADWRRYPQYVMPLTERSIDMIWATAVGSTKKNATDIRLAIDAIELVFTRPEIGTYIILSGDSDFSSLVLKLKEYGKYVIGIGIRESASDLLIQNCDEYYSYSELAGLNKEVDTPSVQRDPWELVREAVERMIRQGDVMRSDRLKQVMQQIDPNFDERVAGYNRFSKFVTEAGTRGLITITRQDNGQFEVGLPSTTNGAKAPVGPASQALPAKREEAREGGRRGRGRRDRRETEAKPAAAPKPPALPALENLTLSGAFNLMTRALGELPSPAPHDLLRARMAALLGREDPLLDTARFHRLLRQANDAEIADVRKLAEDSYEVTMSRVERAKIAGSGNGRAHSLTPPPAPAPAPAEEMAVAVPTTLADISTSGEIPIPRAEPAGLRFRRGSSRAPLRPTGVSLVGAVALPAKAVADAEGGAPEPTGKSTNRKTPRKKRGPKKPDVAQPVLAIVESEQPAADTTTGEHPTQTSPSRAKRGGRPRRRGKAA